MTQTFILSEEPHDSPLPLRYRLDSHDTFPFPHTTEYELGPFASAIKRLQLQHCCATHVFRCSPWDFFLIRKKNNNNNFQLYFETFNRNQQRTECS